MGDARVHFQENTSSLLFIEGGQFLVTQSDIDNDVVAAIIFELGEITACVDVTPDTDVALQARLAENTNIVVDRVCPEFAPGTDYTVIVQDAAFDGFEILCTEGLADASLCP